MILMRQYRLRQEGEELQIVECEAPPPAPGPGEVVVRMRAASLNYRDLLMLRGSSGSGGGGEVIPLSDGSGEVAEVGPGVVEFRRGDRVAACFFPDWEEGPFELRYHRKALGGSVDGVLTEYAVFPASALVEAPPHLSFEESACLPCAALTAWHALVERGALAAGETVLVLGTGGVAVFALQIAVAHGARVIVTSRSPAKLERALELGAWTGVPVGERPDWDRAVWDLTDKRGVDHVVEVGGPGTLGRSLNSLAAEGRIALIGVLTGKGPPDASLFQLLARNARVDGIYVGSRAMFERMNDFFTQHAIHPAIDRVFGFGEAAEAYAHLASGSHFGKVVIRFDES